MRRYSLGWLRRLRLGLNYLPVLFAALFALWFSLVGLGVANKVAVVVLSFGVAAAIVEAVGRRPYVVLSGSGIEIRNIFKTHRLSPANITGLRLHTLRLGKDTCPALVVRREGDAVPLLAWLDWDPDRARLELNRHFPGLDLKHESTLRRMWRWLSR